MTQPATGSTCYRHPDRLTGLSCTECGRSICPACSIDAAVGQRCPDCVARQGTQRVVNARTLGHRAASTPVTNGIIGVTVVFFLAELLGLPFSDEMFAWLAMWNQAIALGEWWRMLSVVLLHANTVHILFNMWALYNLGPQIEREVGGLRLMTLYLASAAAGSAFAFHLGSPGDVGVGASGAIFGLFGVWMASALRGRNTAQGRFLLNQLGFILLINAVIPFIYPNVSWQAHLGGFVAGLVIGQAWARIKGSHRALWHLASAGLILVISVLSTFL